MFVAQAKKWSTADFSVHGPSELHQMVMQGWDRNRHIPKTLNLVSYKDSVEILALSPLLSPQIPFL